MSTDRDRLPSTRGSTQFSRFVLAFVLFACAAVAIWFGRGRDRGDLPQTVTIYAFTAMEEVLRDAILPRFQEHWRQSTGQRVEFVTTFAASGIITDEIVTRFPAQVAILSSTVDARRLVDRPRSARALRQRFDEGDADVMPIYEQELLDPAYHPRTPVEIVHPPITIMTEHVVVRIDRNTPAEARAAVKALIEFLWSEEAQSLFAHYGFYEAETVGDRPPEAMSRMFTLSDLGTPQTVRRQIIDDLWRDRILPTLED